MKRKKRNERGFANYFHVLALPWCCILPIAVAFFGLAGGTLGAFLSNLTPYFLAISVVLIGYSNYNVWFGRFRSPNHRIWVTLITILAAIAWLWSIIFVMKWIVI